MPVARPVLPPRLRAALSQALRLGLPLGALVLMSTIFLASRNVDPNRAVAMSDLDLVALTREPRIGAARISGVTTDNAAVTISATAIRSVTDPQSNAPLNLILDQPEGQVTFAGGGDVVFGGTLGEFDQADNMIALSDAVSLRASSGYAVTLDALQADLAATRITGTGPIRGTGPAGSLSANTLLITALPDIAGGYLLAFKGDVRLLYVPQQ